MFQRTKVMSSKFLSSSTTNLTDGSATIYAASLAASNLKANTAVKVNTQNQLYSTLLDIDDTTGLQAALNAGVSNPVGDVLDMGINRITGLANPTIDSDAVNLLYFNANAGPGDFLADGTVPMSGTLNMGAQVLSGGVLSGGDLKLASNSSATKGQIVCLDELACIDGTAALPSHTFTNDLNAGLSLGDGGEVIVSTAGIARITVAANTTLSGALISDSTTASVSTITGAIQTDGGLGVVLDAHIGGSLNVGSAINSSAARQVFTAYPAYFDLSENDTRAASRTGVNAPYKYVYNDVSTFDVNNSADIGKYTIVQNKTIAAGVAPACGMSDKGSQGSGVDSGGYWLVDNNGTPSAWQNGVNVSLSIVNGFTLDTYIKMELTAVDQITFSVSTDSVVWLPGIIMDTTGDLYTDLFLGIVDASGGTSTGPDVDMRIVQPDINLYNGTDLTGLDLKFSVGQFTNISRQNFGVIGDTTMSGDLKIGGNITGDTGTGWGYWVSTDYATPIAMAVGVKTKLINNGLGGNVIDQIPTSGHLFWNQTTSLIEPEFDGDCYDLEIRIEAENNNASGYYTLSLEIGTGGTLVSIPLPIFNFPKGANTSHDVSSTTLIFCKAAFFATGGTLFLTSGLGTTTVSKFSVVLNRNHRAR